MKYFLYFCPILCGYILFSYGWQRYSGIKKPD